MPMQDVKVVILGQDPYPQPNQAIGYSFAVNTNCTIPTSLRIIFKELDLHYHQHTNPKDRTLTHWIKQGVFLLNTALTVEKGKAGSHLKLWENFTKEVIGIISREINPIWILWGKKAQSFEPIILENFDVLKHNIVPSILTSNHPASEAYNPGKGGFYGCNHFNLTNEILEQRGKQKIYW